MMRQKQPGLRFRRTAIPIALFLALAALLLSVNLHSVEAADGDFVIYDDELAEEWEEVPERTRTRLDNSAPTYEGNRSLRVDFRQGNAALLLRTNLAIYAPSFEALQFAVYGADSRVGALAVTVIDGMGNAGSGAVLVDVPVAEWSIVTIPLSQLGNPAVIGGLRLEKTGGSQPWSPFFLDAIRLAPEAGAAPTATASPPGLTATPAPAVATGQPGPTATEPAPADTTVPPTSLPPATSTTAAPAPTLPPPTPTLPPATPTLPPPTPTAPPATATSSPAPPPSGSAGIWISPAEIAALPTTGAGWQAVLNWAQQSSNAPNLSDQNDQTDAVVVAKAMVYVRTGDARYREQVASAILAAMGTEDGGNTLALSRNLAGYVIAAELVGLSGAEDQAFRSWLAAVRSEHLDGRTLISTHENRPNNWGTHAGASRIAAALYLGDAQDLQQAAAVFRGWLGDRSAYAGFSFGELDWQADPARPVGVNPVGATIQGYDVDGVLPDDQRRAGAFTWPPPQENYVWEALQGAVAQARMLSRTGYDAFNWSDRAILRAVTWLHEEASFPATGDDEGTPWLVNGVYGASFPAVTGARPGKNGLGWYEWFYGR